MSEPLPPLPPTPPPAPPSSQGPFLPPRDPTSPEPPSATADAPFFRPAAPPGYVPYGAGNLADVRSSSGLGRATAALFWVVTAISGLLAFALFSRGSKWDDFVADTATLQDLDNADRFVGLAALLQILVQIASIILVALWARRIALNAKARRSWAVSPGLAAGGWFIPIGWFWVGFNQLRKSTDAVGVHSKNLGRWQGAFAVVGVSGLIARGFSGDIDASQSASEVGDSLNRQGVVGLVTLAAFALASFFATKAIKEIDQAVSSV